MKFNTYLVGNHSCSNRGDAAITRGLIECLSKERENIIQTIYSRYPKGASEILQMDVKYDKTELSDDSDRSLPLRIIRKLRRDYQIDTILMLAIGTYYFRPLKLLLPKKMTQTIDDFKKADLIIQVGGSFFVDLYGMSQFRLLLCALIANKPICLIGHSVGPFGDGIYKKIAGWCLNKATSIVIRDAVSEKMMIENYPDIKFQNGADTAWLVEAKNTLEKKKCVAITSRDLAPFDKRLGISQTDYEKLMASACDYLVSLDYDVKIFSTCTSFDGYHKDDRLTAQSIYLKLADVTKSRVSVVTEELNDIELGQQISECKFTIGTRLHSAIISMNFGTPAIAVGYEHKSIGLYESMDLGNFVIDLANFNLQTLLNMIDTLSEDLPAVESQFNNAVKIQRALAKDETLKSIDNIINGLN